MKSSILFLLLLLLAGVPAIGQNDFKVIKVNGTIMLRQRGISLETGTVFSDKEDLLFRSEDATAAVINAQRGRMVITNKNHDLASARSNYLPSMYNISSRGGSLSQKSDLSNRFSGKYVVFDREGIQIDDATFPMDQDHFFFLRYLYRGEEINKKLGYAGDTLIIDKKALFTVDGKPIPAANNTSIKLYYKNGNESLFISQFDLIFPDMEKLAKETAIILGEVKEKSSVEKLNEVGSYITDFYGKISPASLSVWLNQKFGIK